jgi:hypothetical protein
MNATRIAMAMTAATIARKTIRAVSSRAGAKL